MTSFILKNRTAPLFIIFTLVGLMMLAIGKDLLHSSIKHYHFYLSESMLFGVFWPLFVPLLLLSKKLVNGLKPAYSILLSLLFGILHVFLFSLLVFSVSALFFNHTFGMGLLFTNALEDYGIACLLIYGAFNFIFNKTKKPAEEVGNTTFKIRVNHKDKVVLVSPDEILYVKTERPYIALVTKQRTYLHNDSLKKFLNGQLAGSFVQIHKSVVVNTDFISSYKSRNNGDYDVMMSNGKAVRASRNYNAYFKLGS